MFHSFEQISSACHFFSIQFRQHMSDVAKEVNVSSSMDSSNAVARDASIFSKVVLGHDDVWGALFYCLRCGDLVAARDLLHGNNSGVDSAATKKYLYNTLKIHAGVIDAVAGSSSSSILGITCTCTLRASIAFLISNIRR